MNSWANFWSFATAFGTISMAVATVVIIWQGKRQHKDDFRPICFLEPPGGVDTLYNRRELIERGGLAEDNSSYGILLVQYALRNVGTGPALNLRIQLGFSDGQVTHPWELTPLAPGENRGGAVNPLRVPVRLNDPRNQIYLPLEKMHFENPGNFKGGMGTLRKIWLEYEDNFGKRFRTTHDISPVTEDGQFQPWVTSL